MYYGHNPKFPDNFMWGASSAAWQVEGGVADGGRTPAIIDRWLNAGKIEGISLSRPLILDPALPNKWKNGSQEKARCISCNKCFASAPLGCGAFSKDA